MREAGSDVAGNQAAASARSMALLERFSYAVASRQIVFDDDAMLDTLTACHPPRLLRRPRSLRPTSAPRGGPRRI